MIKDKNLLLPVSAFLAGFDIFLVLTPIGVTQQIMKKAPEVLPAVGLNIPKPAATPTMGPVEPFAFVGPADFLFMGMFFVAIHRFDLKARDTALWMKRSRVRPNVVSQEIKSLQPGRLYSLRLFTADGRDLSVKQEHAVSIAVEGASVLREKCFRHVFANSYSHHYGPYNDKHNAWMNYHWMIFRATGDRATLRISDWASAAEPGGPVGQELLVNLVQVQPFEESPR